MNRTSGEIPTNEEVIPVIESSIFGEHEASQFAIGVVAVGDQIVPGFESEYKGYLMLRGNVYAGQEHYMSEDDLNSDGTESDSDDARSIHIGAFENTLDGTRVVGGIRLILKAQRSAASMSANLLEEALIGNLADLNDLFNKRPNQYLANPLEIATEAPLPIEEHYPNAFAGTSTPFPSNEASRLIARHETSRVQHAIAGMVLAVAVGVIDQHELGDTYGAVKPGLARSFRIGGMPVTELGEAVFVPEFNAKKQPIHIDIPEYARRLEVDQLSALEAGRRGLFMYSGVAPRIQRVLSPQPPVLTVAA